MSTRFTDNQLNSRRLDALDQLVQIGQVLRVTRDLDGRLVISFRGGRWSVNEQPTLIADQELILALPAMGHELRFSLDAQGVVQSALDDYPEGHPLCRLWVDSQGQIQYEDVRTVGGGQYTKPSGGIPEGDLSAEVVDKLAQGTAAYEEVTAARGGADLLGTRLDRMEGDLLWLRGIQSQPIDLGTISPPDTEVYDGSIRLKYNATGLLGKYYTSEPAGNFTTFKGQQVDPRIDFNWGTSANPVTGVSTNWAACWTGYVRASVTGIHTFYVTADDGIRLWVNGQLIINHWALDSGTTYSGTISLEAGKVYPIQLDFYEGPGAAIVRLEWSAPGLARQVVPQAALSPTGYEPAAEYTSAVLDAGGDMAWLEVDVSRNVPAGTTCEVSVALSDDGTTFSPWQTIADHSTVLADKKRYLKYRLVLTTSDPTQTPVIENLTFVHGQTTSLSEITSRVRALETEVSDARDTYPTLADRLASMGGGGSGVLGVADRFEYIATGGETAISLPFSYNPGRYELLVFQNGIFLRPGADNDYVETNTNTITFNDPLEANDGIIVMRVASIAAAIWEDWQDLTPVTVSLPAGGQITGTMDLPTAFVRILAVELIPVTALSGFRVRFTEDEAGQVVDYELDTSATSGYTPGATVRDPEQGYDSIPYINAAGLPKLYYEIINLDPNVAGDITLKLRIERA